MICTLCKNSMEKKTINWTVFKTHHHQCIGCKCYTITDEDIKADMEFANTSIGKHVYINSILCRFHTYSSFLGVKLKIAKVHTNNGYITCDLSNIDDDTIVVEQLAHMYVHGVDEFYIGELVKFNEKVYDEPYTPYYDEYAGHTFMVEEIIVYDEDPDYKPVTHYKLKCVTGNVIVQGNVHQDEIISACRLP